MSPFLSNITTSDVPHIMLYIQIFIIRELLVSEVIFLCTALLFLGHDECLKGREIETFYFECNLF